MKKLMFLKKSGIRPEQTGNGKSFFPFRSAMLLLFLIPIIEFYALEWFTHNPWTTMYIPVQLWNILLYELVFWGLFFLTGTVSRSVALGTVLFALIGTANYYVMEFRSAPIVPWDIYSLGTAAEVADNYDYTLGLRPILVLLVFALMLITAFLLRRRSPGFSLKVRIPAFLLSLLLIAGYIVLLSQDSFVSFLNLDNTLFTPHVMARKNGFCVSWLMDLRYLRVSEPDGYNREEIESLLASETSSAADDSNLIFPDSSTGNDAAAANSADSSSSNNSADTEAGSFSADEISTPDIVVIMDEAFSDPAVLGIFTTNEDYMPFMHSLQNDNDSRTQTGWLNVSVKGGNTANTEYEFLTGSSMRFLPAGSVPYQQYIFGSKPSLVSHLEELGYTTTSIHPFNASGWNRDKVYEYFGFDSILFNTDFSMPKRIRKYICDEACFDKIEEVLNSGTDDPHFVFAVTMQNHSSYKDAFDNFTPDITVNDAPESQATTLLQNYLSLMKLTDQALEKLLSDLSESDRPTIVVFFGDHQPNDIVVRSIWKMNGVSDTDLTTEQLQQRYKVPYLIWSNYDLPNAGIRSGTDTDSEGMQQTSVNYLAALVLESAGIPLSDWEEAELDIYDTLPVISTQRVALSDGSEADTSDEEVQDLLNRYNQIQYYEQFDSEG